MACPLFIPGSSLGELVAVAAPLGDLYGGRCAGDPAAAIDPDVLRGCCNFGYARGRCERAARSEADAVRLMVRAERGGVVEIAWAVERDHHPVRVGILEIAAGSVAGSGDDVILRQARACAAAYLRWKKDGQDGGTLCAGIGFGVLGTGAA